MLSKEELCLLKACIHLVKMNGQYYLFATRANRLFLLTPDEANTVEQLLSIDAASADAASIVSKEDAVLLEHLYEICAMESRLGAKPKLNSMVLLVSEACNFACTYCYGSYGERTRKMSADTAIQAINLGLELGIRDIVFFGGEPLTNFPVIRRAVEYVEGTGNKAITLRMTTNGSLVSETIAAYLHEHHFQVSVSMDGDQASQDMTRIYHDNSSTYQDVIRGINLLKKYHVLTLLEVTYSARHKDLKKQLQTALSIFPVVSCACVDGGQDSCRNADVISGSRFQEFYHTLLDAEQQLKEGETLIGAQELYNKICNGEPLTLPRYICSDIGTRLVIAPDGSVAPCPEMLGRKEYLICNVNSITSAQNLLDLREEVLNRLVSDRVEQKWFTGLCETCIQHVREKDGRFEYVDESSFESCVDSLLTRFLREQHA